MIEAGGIQIQVHEQLFLLQNGVTDALRASGYQGVTDEAGLLYPQGSQGARILGVSQAFGVFHEEQGIVFTGAEYSKSTHWNGRMNATNFVPLERGGMKIDSGISFAWHRAPSGTLIQEPSLYYLRMIEQAEHDGTGAWWGWNLLYSPSQSAMRIYYTDSYMQGSHGSELVASSVNGRSLEWMVDRRIPMDEQVVATFSGHGVREMYYFLLYDSPDYAFDAAEMYARICERLPDER